jgi:hypothetical protein
MYAPYVDGAKYSLVNILLAQTAIVGKYKVYQIIYLYTQNPKFGYILKGLGNYIVGIFYGHLEYIMGTAI